jgi:NitT/TauT family transport system ATP-binding protein
VGEPIIQFENVDFSFGGEQIYTGLNFAIEKEAFVCILGPSGCGKSTSLRLMGDLLPYSNGRVTVTGRTPAEAWQEIAYVFQSPRLVPWRNAIQNVTLAAELRFGRGNKREREEKARELLSLVGLERDMQKYPAALSGGERQRVSIARALAVEPEIILMDEPFSALDVNTRHRLRAELISIWQRTRKTIVFVTHDVDEALVLADQIIVLSSKPTRVIDTVNLSEPRPRRVEDSAGLTEQRNYLHNLFRMSAQETHQDAHDDERHAS